MTVEARDLIVLGAGPGGYVAAIRGAQLGRRVTIIEREALGGVCLNWGCIPSKALLYSAKLYHDIKRAAEFGIDLDGVKADFPRIIARSRDVASRLSNGVSFLMKKNKVEVLMGTAALEGSQRLSVIDSAGRSATYSYNDLIIAAGSRARVLPGVEIDGDTLHTYRTALEYKRLPQKLLVIGAGAIGMEFAYFYHTLGAQVTVCEMLEQILPLEDREVADALQKILQKRGMIIKTKSGVSDIKKIGKTVTATLKTPGPDGALIEERWSGDACLIAVGVLPNTENLGLEKAGIALTDRRFIKTDAHMRTNVEHHFAIGDVTGQVLLAHVASHQGLIAAEAASGKAAHGMRYDNIPSCTYCQPQVASVGLSEKACRDRGIKYKVGKIPFSAIGKAIAIGEQDGFIKVIIDEQVGEVLGVHILHAEATELIAEAGVIRSHEGVAASVLETIHAHPTLSESMGEAMAAALGRPINY